MKINTAATAALAHAHQSPAKAARDLLARREDLLVGTPFGQIVSKLARNQKIPEPPPSEPTGTTPPENDTAQSSEGVDVIA